MYNGIVLCQKCHKEADSFNRITGIKGTNFRRRLLKITILFWQKDQWWRDFIPQKDKLENNRFLDLVSDDLIAIKDG